MSSLSVTTRWESLNLDSLTKWACTFFVSSPVHYPVVCPLHLQVVPQQMPETGWSLQNWAVQESAGVKYWNVLEDHLHLLNGAHVALMSEQKQTNIFNQLDGRLTSRKNKHGYWIIVSNARIAKICQNQSMFPQVSCNKMQQSTKGWYWILSNLSHWLVKIYYGIITFKI